MNSDEYQTNARRTRCSMDLAHNCLAATTGERIQLLHSVLGLMGEVGELASALEKWIFYGQDLDVVNVKEEFGDCEWYIAEGCDALGMRLADVLERNIAKLRKRYPEKFTQTSAVEENRDREVERKIIEGSRITMSQPTVNSEDQLPITPETSYQRYCQVCRVAKIHNHNKSGLCPDCAADRRRLTNIGNPQ